MCPKGVAIEHFKTAFPPLLIELQQHQAFLREVAAAASGEAGGERPQCRYWSWFQGEGRHLIDSFGDPELREAWNHLGQAHADFLAAAEASLDAAARGDRQGAARDLRQAFAFSATWIGILVGASLRELMQAFMQREHALAERYERDFLDAAQIGRFSVRLSDRQVTDADDNFLGFFRVAREAVLGLDVRRLIGDASYQELAAATVEPGKTARVMVKVHDVEQREVVLEIVAHSEKNQRGMVLRCFAVNMSQSESEAQQRRLLSTAIEASDEIVMITNSRQEIVYVNAAFTRITGYEAEEVLGKTPRLLQGAETSQATRIGIREALAAGGQVHAEILNYTKEGRSYWVDMSIVPVTDSNGLATHYIAIERDISERKVVEQEMARLAMEDHLTGLSNRRAAEERLHTEWNRARRDRNNFAVAIVDIDRFKLVNDQYGHHIGDQTLRHVADTLSGNLRGGDWMARWGGEEFLVCFHDLDNRGAMIAGERLRKLVKAKPLKLAQGDLPVTISIGVALYQPDSESIDALLTQADSLLYEAKQSGRDKVLCAGMADGRQGSVIWEGSQVQSALHEQRVIPAFQPIVDLRTGRFVAEEALARIVTKDNNLIPAQNFIQAAEALHLVAAIDRTIAGHALARSAETKQQQGDEQAHFINLSPQFLANQEDVRALLDLAQHYQLALGKNSGNPMVIEITERQGANMQKLKQGLRPLFDAGFRLALDDFGSGYSSFMYLAELPVNFIKLEGWMVGRIARDKRVRQLVETLVNTAQKFKVLTIAECVEDAQTAQVLCDIGVDWAQGHYFARPEVLDEMYKSASVKA